MQSALAPKIEGIVELDPELPQYLGKGADLRHFSLRNLDDIAERINTRPRRVLNWAKSHDLFWAHVRAQYVS